MSDAQQAPTAIVITMPAGPGYFPATDERAGAYEDGQILSIPGDLSPEKAQALIASGYARDLDTATQPEPAPPVVDPAFPEGDE